MSSQNTECAQKVMVLTLRGLTSAQEQKEAIAECSNILCVSEQMTTAYENEPEHFGIWFSERTPTF